MIDCIEHNVAKAVEYVEDAASDVDTAYQYHKKATHVKRQQIQLYVNTRLILLFLFF